MSLDLGPHPPLGYTQNPLERAAEQRNDPAQLAALAADQRARTYLIAGELVIAKRRGEEGDPLFTPAEARALVSTQETVFLGRLDGAGRFGMGVAAETAEALKDRADLLVADLRSIAVKGRIVAPEHLPPIAEAKALLAWHARHRFCGNCGAATELTQGGWRRDCPQCKAEHFPRTDPVVIMLPIRGGQCLLGRQARFAPGMWSCLAGFIEPGESIEEAVRRETQEEAGIIGGRVRYYASQPWPFPSSLMIGCFVEALSSAITIDRTELEDARWFGHAEVMQMLLRRHPDNLFTPAPVAIGHHIIRAWAAGEARDFT